MSRKFASLATLLLLACPNLAEAEQLKKVPRLGFVALSSSVLVINIKTAQQIGLTIPPNLLARADKVIR